MQSAASYSSSPPQGTKKSKGLALTPDLPPDFSIRLTERLDLACGETRIDL